MHSTRTAQIETQRDECSRCVACTSNAARRWCPQECGCWEAINSRGSRRQVGHKARRPASTRPANTHPGSRRATRQTPSGQVDADPTRRPRINLLVPEGVFAISKQLRPGCSDRRARGRAKISAREPLRTQRWPLPRRHQHGEFPGASPWPFFCFLVRSLSCLVLTCPALSCRIFFPGLLLLLLSALVCAVEPHLEAFWSGAGHFPTRTFSPPAPRSGKGRAGSNPGSCIGLVAVRIGPQRDLCCFAASLLSCLLTLPLLALWADRYPDRCLLAEPGKRNISLALSLFPSFRLLIRDRHGAPCWTLACCRASCGVSSCADRASSG